MREAAIMILTFLFGIVPATLLAFWAILLGAAGVVALFQFGEPAVALLGLVAATAGVLSLPGYVALFYAAGDAVTPKVARWLAGGVAANVIGVGFALNDPEWFSPTFWFILAAPLVVGCAHLVRFGVRRLPARSRRS